MVESNLIQRCRNVPCMKYDISSFVVRDWFVRSHSLLLSRICAVFTILQVKELSRFGDSVDSCSEFGNEH